MFKTKPQVTLERKENLLLALGRNSTGDEIRIVLDTAQAKQCLGRPLPVGFSYSETLREMYFMFHARIGTQVKLFPAVQTVIPGFAYLVTGFDGTAYRVSTEDARLIRSAIDELLASFGVLRTIIPAQAS